MVSLSWLKECEELNKPVKDLKMHTKLGNNFRRLRISIEGEHSSITFCRALLEEEYGKTLLQIAHKQKASSLENGSSKNALDTMQAQFQSVAESHLQLSDHLRENVALPLSKLLNKQRVLRKEVLCLDIFFNESVSYSNSFLNI